MMRKSNIITSAHVRCSGHVHTISITKDGALIFHDHPHLREELAFLALGGDPCPCLQVLQAWRQKNVTEIPESLWRFFYRADRKAYRRLMERISPNVDPLTVPLRERVVQRTVLVAKQALESCVYRHARSRGVDNHYVEVTIGRPDVVGYVRQYARQVGSKNGRRSNRYSYITASVPLTWLVHVYKRGLAVVDGMFVLDLLGEDERGIIVLAGRQGRGFEVYPCRALVIRAMDGQYHIRRWIKE